MSDSNLKLELDSIFASHMNAELAGDLDQTLGTMASNPHLVNVPTMVGWQGRKVSRPSTTSGSSGSSSRRT